MRFVKILCTLGPATDRPGMIEELARAGMDAARINFSHGDETAQRPRVEAVRAAERAIGRPLAVVADLQGPKIRLGRFPDGPVQLDDGDEIVLAAGDGPCSGHRLTVDYPELADAVCPGGDIFLADGYLHLRVEEIRQGDVRCRVVRGGPLSDRKGVNLPGVPLHMPTLTEHDYRDALGAVRLGCDFIALSFVRSAGDVKTLRDFLLAHQAQLPIIVKLERPEALTDLESVLEAADAVMVARGDLGVEVGVAKVPALQKRILAAARRLRKPAIVATQMLESMTTSPIPTRAEASDVANAILDGADVVMLSGETAAGRYPLETVRMMTAIAQETEPLAALQTAPAGDAGLPGVAEAVINGVLAMTEALQPRAIVAYTHSGSTARLLAKRRPPVPVIALTSCEKISRLGALYFGCIPRQAPALARTDEIFGLADRLLIEGGFAAPGDRIIVVAGLPFNKPGTTNLIHVHEVGTT
ncbi:MAG: pyruvate kinase [Myxococcales bacterium]|nr:pyruvate kinase [Myxococcales bacterium]